MTENEAVFGGSGGMSRSPAEILFRVRQESVNVRLWLAPPEWPAGCGAGGSLGLPPIAEIRPLLDGTRYEEELHAMARRCAGGELPAFGQWLQPEGEIRWRRDYPHGKETPATYFRRIPYLDFERVGDHKWIWEMNRHQHLVLLAQAWALDPQSAYRDAIVGQWESWLRANQPQRGINWTSALEVAVRALSWIWILHLAGAALPESLRTQVLRSLRIHGLHLAANLSIYFSPNTHLLGEALALEALGRFLPGLPEAELWRERGAYWVRECLRRHVMADGSYFEQSSYYHIYALDMFLLSAIWGRGGRLDPAVGRMAEFAEALLGEDGRMPFLGDDDGGRLFHPFGPRAEFGRGTMAVYAALGGAVTGGAEWLDREAACPMAAWWLGARAQGCWETRRGPGVGSRLFASAGWAVLAAGGVDGIVDAGPFGSGSGGHSHADALSLTLRRNGREVLIDPGTFTYLADPAWRERFRAASSHSTIAVEGLPQAEPAGPFRWARIPAVRLLGWRSDEERDELDAVCEYGGVRHRRVLRFDKKKLRVWIADVLEGAARPGAVRQNWRLAEAPEELGPRCYSAGGARITLDENVEMSIEPGWRSVVLGSREEAPVLAVRWTGGALAMGRVTVIDWVSGPEAAEVFALWTGGQVAISINGTDPDRAILKISDKDDAERD
jgi:hypothetical protein